MNAAKQYCHAGHVYPVVQSVGGLQSQLSTGFITVILFKPVMELAEGGGGGGVQVNNKGKRISDLDMYAQAFSTTSRQYHNYGVCLSVADRCLLLLLYIT